MSVHWNIGAAYKGKQYRTLCGIEGNPRPLNDGSRYLPVSSYHIENYHSSYKSLVTCSECIDLLPVFLLDENNL